MKQSRITDEMYATIPGLIAQGLTHFEIAAQFGVKRPIREADIGENDIALGRVASASQDFMIWRAHMINEALTNWW